MAAQVEEVVVHAHPLDLEHLGPDPGERLLERVAGRNVLGTRVERGGTGVGQRIAIDLAVGGEWQASPACTKAEGIIGSGSAVCNQRRSSTRPSSAAGRGTT